MRAVIGCEYSAIVRDAFLANGHDAWSVDLLPTEGDPSRHFQGDLFEFIDSQPPFDLGIFHPTCTFLTNAANRWLTEDCATGTAQQRIENREKAIQFFRRIQALPIPRKAIENPQPHPYVIEQVGRYQQKVQPWEFGHPETKGICLWLYNLPPLISTMNVYAEMMRLPYSERAKVHSAAPGKDRGKIRSRFYTGIGTAMADQWG